MISRLVLLLALLAGGVAQAQDGQIERWLRMDKNGDGKLARNETTGPMRRFFDRNDANKDGHLDRSELAALRKRLAGNRPDRQPNTQRNRQQVMSTERLRETAPDDVVIEPDLAYRPGDSKAWRLDLVRPKAKSDQTRPGIVFVHGGGWRSGDKRTGAFLSGAIEYAQKGYVCITVNYRLTGEAKFPACIEDVKCAVRWFRANAKKYNLDPNRLGAYGNSAGAHLVSMLGLCKAEAGLEGDGPHQDQSSLVQAVCASATPSKLDLFARSPNVSDRFAADSEEEVIKLVQNSSPSATSTKTLRPSSSSMEPPTERST